VEKKTIEGERTREIIEELRKKYPKDVGAPGPEVKLGAGAGTTTAEGANGAPDRQEGGTEEEGRVATTASVRTGSQNRHSSEVNDGRRAQRFQFALSRLGTR